MKCLTGFLITLLTLASVNSMAEAQPPKAGEVKHEPYVFKAANGETVDAGMGRLFVPENRRDPKSRVIELAFVRLKSRSKNPGPPIIYLVGGPGGQAISQVRTLFPLYSHLLEAGDLILLDQRGTGMSKPNLQCRERLNYPLDQPLERDHLLRLMKEQSRACAQYWREQGVDLSGYNTNESADDVNALRQALGIDKLNLFGTSYGTHLSLAVIRRHGEHLNRAIIAGIEGPDHTYKLPSQIQKNLEDIARIYRNDPQIGKDLPDLMGLLRTIGERLEKQPATVEVTDPANQQKVKVTVGKLDFQFFLTSLPGRVARIKTFPATVYAMSKGDFTVLGETSLSVRRESIGSAMSFMMDCASAVSPERWKRIEREEKETLIGRLTDFPFPEICEAWNASELEASFRAPVKSQLPVLLISGELDGRTPASNAEEVRRGFPNSHHLIVEAAGHVDATMFTPQTKEVMIEFLQGKPVTITKIPAPPLELAPLKKEDSKAAAK